MKLLRKLGDAMRPERTMLRVAALIGASLALSSASSAEPAARVHKRLPAAPVYNWTGFYVGLNAGLGSAQSRGLNALNTAPNKLEDNGRGVAGGLQAGFNWQFAPNWVVGVEGDAGFLGIDRTTVLTFEYETALKTGGYGTLRGRFGYAAGPSLVYVTGGAAFVRTEDQWNYLGNPFVPFAAQPHSTSKIASGWTVGAGVEAMLAPGWSARAEYLLIDTGKGTTQVINVNPAEPSAMRVDHAFHVFRLGLNYMFGAGASPAAMRPPFGEALTSA